MLNFTLRPYDLDTDAAIYAALLTAHDEETATEETVRQDDERRRAENQTYREITAIDGDGRPVGFSYAGRNQWGSADKLRIALLVAPTMRGQGIGSALYVDAAAWAEAQKPVALNTAVRDNDQQSLAFAQKRGFVTERYRFVSLLDLAHFDAARFAGAITAKQAGGIRIVSLAELGDTEEVRRKLHAVNTLAVRSEPAYDGTDMTFEEFSRLVFTAWWFRPDCQFLALDGEEYIGICALGYNQAGNTMFNAFTGVHPDYRGRGLALAMKVQATDFAKQQGIVSIRTNNDSENPAMLAINEKLGYARQPGVFQMRRSL